MRPILFPLPFADVPVYSYGFMLGLSLVVGWNLALYLAWREGVSVRRVAAGVVAVIVLALLGSRVLHLLVNPAELVQPAVWLDLRGGIVAYGGLLGGTLAAYLVFRSSDVGFLRGADLLAPPVAVGIALTRTGCFLNGCDFGIPTTLPWGVRFPRDRHLDASWMAGPSPAWQHHFDTGAFLQGETVTAASPWSLPVHPTQLYESLLGVALLVALMHAWKRKRFRGEVFLLLTVGYGVGRAFIECFRGDAQRGALLGVSTSQFVGLVTALVAFAILIVLRSRSPGHHPPVP